MKQKFHEGQWVVIVTMLLQDKDDNTKFVFNDFGIKLKAHTKDGAEWRAVKMIWQDALSKKVMQPIVGVNAITVGDYEKAVAATKAQEEGEKVLGPDNAEPPAPIPLFPDKEVVSGTPAV